MDRWSFVALTEVIDIGKFGVIVFFAISGYVIPSSLMKRTDHAVPRFVIARFFRLYPAYWLSLPAGLAIFLVVAHQHVDAPLVVANVTMLQQFFGIENILGIYWTLQIELIFYALCVGLFVIGLLQKTKFIFSTAVIFLAFATVLAAARFYSGVKLPVVVPLSLAIMFWGMIRRQADDGERDAVKADVGLLGDLRRGDPARLVPRLQQGLRIQRDVVPLHDQLWRRDRLLRAVHVESSGSISPGCATSAGSATRSICSGRSPSRSSC